MSHRDKALVRGGASLLWWAWTTGIVLWCDSARGLRLQYQGLVLPKKCMDTDTSAWIAHPPQLDRCACSHARAFSNFS